jgi:hypothetical protein
MNTLSFVLLASSVLRDIEVAEFDDKRPEADLPDTGDPSRVMLAPSLLGAG